MSTEQILALLISERDRLNRAIEALGGESKSASVTAPVASSSSASKRRKPMSPAQKKAHSERMKAYWAARRKEK